MIWKIKKYSTHIKRDKQTQKMNRPSLIIRQKNYKKEERLLSNINKLMKNNKRELIINQNDL